MSGPDRYVPDEEHAAILTVLKETSDARDSLLSRVEELEKDAARYRWLRAQYEYVRHSQGEVQCQYEDWEHEDDGLRLDAAIDAALKEQQT